MGKEALKKEEQEKGYYLNGSELRLDDEDGEAGRRSNKEKMEGGGEEAELRAISMNDLMEALLFVLKGNPRLREQRQVMMARERATYQQGSKEYNEEEEDEEDEDAFYSAPFQ